jgi:hypothetical protein
MYVKYLFSNLVKSLADAMELPKCSRPDLRRPGSKPVELELLL